MQDPLLRAEDQGGRTVRSFLSEHDTQQAIKMQFARFLREFQDDNQDRVYVDRMADMLTGDIRRP